MTRRVWWRDCSDLDSWKTERTPCPLSSTRMKDDEFQTRVDDLLIKTKYKKNGAKMIKWCARRERGKMVTYGGRAWYSHQDAREGTPGGGMALFSDLKRGKTWPELPGLCWFSPSAERVTHNQTRQRTPDDYVRTCTLREDEYVPRNWTIALWFLEILMIHHEFIMIISDQWWSWWIIVNHDYPVMNGRDSSWPYHDCFFLLGSCPHEPLWTIMNKSWTMMIHDIDWNLENLYSSLTICNHY